MHTIKSQLKRRRVVVAVTRPGFRDEMVGRHADEDSAVHDPDF